jgi:hypothetical protein
MSGAGFFLGTQSPANTRMRAAMRSPSITCGGSGVQGPVTGGLWAAQAGGGCGLEACWEAAPAQRVVQHAAPIPRRRLSAPHCTWTMLLTARSLEVEQTATCTPLSIASSGGTAGEGKGQGHVLGEEAPPLPASC